MELRHLRYFVAVAEELHFRHAAERLHIAQPAVSEQVRKLEAELGVRLLDRTQRSVSLTVPGAAMLEEARRVLHQADVAQQAARSARERETGRLRVGYLADSLPPALPVAFSRFTTATPCVELVLQIGQPLRLIDDVRRGLLDVAIVCLPAALAGLHVTPLGVERAIAAVPERHALTANDAIRPDQIEDDTPMLLLPRVVNPAFYDGVIACWRGAGVSAQPVEASEPRVEHALLTVAAGSGIAVLPESAAGRYSIPGVRFMPLTPTPTCEVAAITRNEASVPVAALLRLAQRAARPPVSDNRQRLAIASA